MLNGMVGWALMALAPVVLVLACIAWFIRYVLGA